MSALAIMHQTKSNPYDKRHQDLPSGSQSYYARTRFFGSLILKL